MFSSWRLAKVGFGVIFYTRYCYNRWTLNTFLDTNRLQMEI